MKYADKILLFGIMTIIGLVFINGYTPVTWSTVPQNFKDSIWSMVAGKIKPYSGTTNSSGNFTTTFATPYAVAPNIQAQVIGGTTETFVRITSISTTGFTINVFTRGVVSSLPIVGSLVNTLLGGVTTPLNGASVDVLITEK
ncbi:MAG: hypothetical protein QM791_04060 [Ferruginibacter sp.]